MAEINWTLQTFRLDELTDFYKNPRSLSEKEFKQLKTSLDKFGMIDKPIVNLDSANTIIGGHQRKHVLEASGVKECECWIPDRELSEKEVEELNIRLNKNTGSWDFDCLANEFELDDLLEWGFDKGELDLDLWAEDAPEDVEPQIDKAEELRVKWGVESGQLWQLGEHRLICGDCTDKAVVERVMGGEVAELLFTSPPYADMRTYEGDKDLSIEKLIEFIPAFRDFVNYQVINLGLKRDCGEVIQYWDLYIAKAKNSGYKFLSWNVWNREHATTIGLQSAFFPIFHEWIFVFGVDTKEINKTQPKSEASYERQKYAKPGTRRRKDGVLIPGDRGDTSSDFVKIGTVTTLKVANTIGNSLHPAMFPVELPEEYIKAMTIDSDIVCEPFSGSGTTLIACERLGRKCRAVEISPAYVAVAIQRWVDVTGKEPVLIDPVIQAITGNGG
jgi:DNA modification methylase